MLTLHDEVCEAINKLEFLGYNNTDFHTRWNFITDINTNEIRSGYEWLAKALLKDMKELIKGQTNGR